MPRPIRVRYYRDEDGEVLLALSEGPVRLSASASKVWRELISGVRRRDECPPEILSDLLKSGALADLEDVEWKELLHLPSVSRVPR